MDRESGLRFFDSRFLPLPYGSNSRRELLRSWVLANRRIEGLTPRLSPKPLPLRIANSRPDPDPLALGSTREDLSSSTKIGCPTVIFDAYRASLIWDHIIPQGYSLTGPDVSSSVSTVRRFSMVHARQI